MLRRNTQLHGVNKLWKSLEPLRIRHSGGFSALRARTIKAQQDSGRSGNDIQQIRVGVDGNNLLHHLLRNTDLTKLVLEGDTSDLVRHTLAWARKTHRSICGLEDGGFSSSSSSSSFFGGGATTVGNRIVLKPYQPQQQQQSQSDQQQQPQQSTPQIITANSNEPLVLFVFDGAVPALKQANRALRVRERQSAMSDAAFLAAHGEFAIARSLLTCAPSLFHVHLHDVAVALRGAGFPVLFAPFESDAQLGYLQRKGFVNCVLTADSDAVTFDCRTILRPKNSAVDFDIYDFHTAGEWQLLFGGEEARSKTIQQHHHFTSRSSYASSSEPLSPVAAMFGDGPSAFAAKIAETEYEFSQQQMQHQQPQNQQQQTSAVPRPAAGPTDDLTALLNLLHAPLELRTCVLVASGSDYNAQPRESLPGSALGIWKRLAAMALFSGRQLPTTTRQLCEQMRVPREEATAIATATFAHLQHLVYDPTSKLVIPMNPPESVASLRAFLKELHGTQDPSAAADGQHHHHQQQHHQFHFRSDADIVGARWMPSSAESYCEGLDGVRWRQAVCHEDLERRRIAALGSFPVHHFVRSAARLMSTSTMDQDEDEGADNSKAATTRKELTDCRTNEWLEDDDVEGHKSKNNKNSNDQLARERHFVRRGFVYCEACHLAFPTIEALNLHLAGRKHVAQSKIAMLLKMKTTPTATTSSVATSQPQVHPNVALAEGRSACA